MELRKSRTTILNEGDPEQKRAEILEYFHLTFDIDEKLYETLKYDDTFYRKLPCQVDSWEVEFPV